jgi:hypothetical protein
MLQDLPFTREYQLSIQATIYLCTQPYQLKTSAFQAKLSCCKWALDVAPKLLDLQQQLLFHTTFHQLFLSSLF